MRSPEANDGWNDRLKNGQCDWNETFDLHDIVVPLKWMQLESWGEKIVYKVDYYIKTRLP